VRSPFFGEILTLTVSNTKADACKPMVAKEAGKKNAIKIGTSRETKRQKQSPVFFLTRFPIMAESHDGPMNALETSKIERQNSQLRDHFAPRRFLIAYEFFPQTSNKIWEQAQTLDPTLAGTKTPNPFHAKFEKKISKSIPNQLWRPVNHPKPIPQVKGGPFKITGCSQIPKKRFPLPRDLFATTVMVINVDFWTTK